MRVIKWLTTDFKTEYFTVNLTFINNNFGVQRYIDIPNITFNNQVKVEFVLLFINLNEYFPKNNNML